METPRCDEVCLAYVSFLSHICHIFRPKKQQQRSWAFRVGCRPVFIVMENSRRGGAFRLNLCSDRPNDGTKTLTWY